MNGGIAGMFLLMASILRSLFPTLMSNNAEIGLVKDNPPTDWTSWIVASLKKQRDEHTDVAGLDHAMLLEYCVFCMRLCGLLFVPALTIIAPLCFFFGHGQAEEVGDILSMFGINNVREDHPWLYKVFAVMTVYVVVISHLEIMRSMKVFTQYRSEFLKDLPEPQASTVLVQGIPQDYQSAQKVREFFAKMFSKESVQDVHMVLNIPELESKFAELQNAKLCLEKAKAEWQTAQKAGKKEDAKPKVRISGEDKDAIEYWTLQQGELTNTVKEYQKAARHTAETSTGGTNGYMAFVKFASRRDLRVALSMEFTNDPDEWCVTQADPAPDIIWSDLKVSEESKGAKKTIGYALVLLAYMAFTPFCVWVTGLADKVDVGVFQPLWALYAPTLGLLIFLSFIPTVLIRIFELMFNFQTEIVNQQQLQIYYFWFMFFFVVLVTAVGSSFKQFGEALLEDPLHFPLVLADKLPATSHYYLNFIASQWLTHGLNLTRYIQISKYLGFRKIWDDEDARRMAEPEDQDYYGMGSRSARFTTNMLIVLVFGIISPFMGVLGWINFFLCRLIYGYLVVYAESRKTDSGGVFYVKQLEHTYFGLFIFTLLMTGIFSKRSPTSIPITCAVSSFLFLFWSWRKFKLVAWVNLPWSQLVEIPEAKHREATGGDYVQPELQTLEEVSEK